MECFNSDSGWRDSPQKKNEARKFRAPALRSQRPHFEARADFQAQIIGRVCRDSRKSRRLRHCLLSSLRRRASEKTKSAEDGILQNSASLGLHWRRVRSTRTRAHGIHDVTNFEIKSCWNRWAQGGPAGLKKDDVDLVALMLVVYHTLFVITCVPVSTRYKYRRPWMGRLDGEGRRRSCPTDAGSVSSTNIHTSYLCTSIYQAPV